MSCKNDKKYKQEKSEREQKLFYSTAIFILKLNEEKIYERLWLLDHNYTQLKGAGIAQ